ncbi:mucoidy inhibitor MuiA family protein [Kitasatospora sp. NPDC052896]|uniref:mucoidy inhibitor MuiA family protein n=1 Tax=Kitasatospora sp. NPDC052896 TaxID=3364061 RepID=UPI0037CB079F
MTSTDSRIDAPLPVTAVVCQEDRAQVERTTTVRLTGGPQRLRLGPISALAVDTSLRARFTGPTGAAVLAARITRSWTPRTPGPPSAEDSALRHRLHELEQRLRAGEQRRDRLTTRLDLLDRLTADLLREIAEGTGHGEAEPARWSRELDRAEAEQDAHAERLHALGADLAELAEEHAAGSAALAEAEAEPPELTAVLELTVRSAAPGPATLTVVHLTPCALWRPAYRARFADGALCLESDAVVWQRTGEDWTDARLTLSTARSALAAEPPALREDVLTLRELSAEERRTVDVELREEEIATLGPEAAAPATELPGVDDGGEVRVFDAPRRVSVPGDGRAHRVPLGTVTVPATAELAAVPEFSPLVTELVRFTAPADRPLLAGPVELVRGSGYTGRGELRFTAAGAPAELAFGGSDDYRVHRETEEVRGTGGLPGPGRRSVLTRTVRVHVSRLSPGGERTVTVRERIPVSEVSAVEVRLRREECVPAPAGPDADGVVRWELALPPSGRRTVTLVYEVTASAKVTGL